MTSKVSIPVEAQLDTTAVERSINAFGQRVAQANKVQFQPISVKSIEDIETARKKFEQLLRVHGELNRRVKSTGQTGRSPWEINYDAMFPDASSRARQMRNVMEYTFGQRFTSIPTQPSSPPPHPSGRGGGGVPAGPSWAGVGMNVAQSGLRAAGPIGGVAANSLGTGMSAGFGAGMMGLLGGMAALGIAKVVGAITEKVGAAEENNVALDRLKRTLGDVNVSFNALKAAVHGGADNLRITYQEAGQLATQFVKLGNVSSEQTKTISDELAIGVGLARSFGFDPSQGVGAMGQLRGVGATSNTQDSRRFALLIGETIGKSGAFAKADEVMDALAGYTTAQTRAMLGNANTAGYAGMYSAMVGSGIPGLDPAGASALLGRVNSVLAAGGARGEASQFLTARIGQTLGLDPLQTQIMREGGMFATKRSMFGSGSAYSRYMGGAMSLGSDADTTFFSARMTELKRNPAYASNPMLLAQAMANDTGLSMNQAMVLMGIQPNQMGELSQFANLSSLSGNGIANLAKARYGSSADRQSLALQFLGRTGDDAISSDDRAALSGAIGNDDRLREVLTQISAKYDQEKTLGSDVRDSKALLDNIKTSLADKLVPLVNEMRHGIMFMAGHRGKLSSSEIMQRMINADADDRIGQINGEYKNLIDAKEDEWRKARSEGMRTNDPDEFAKADAIEKDIAKLREEQAEKIRKENAARDATIASLLESERARKEVAIMEREEKERQKAAASASAVGGGRGYIHNYGPPGVAPAMSESLDEKVAAAERATGLPTGLLRSVIAQETGGRTAEFLSDPAKYHYGLDANGRRIAGHTGKVSTAFGPFGILESTAKAPGYGVSPLKNKGMDEQIRFASEYLSARIRNAGSVSAGLAGYGEGHSYSSSVLSRMGRTQMPLDSIVSGGNSGGGLRVSADPIVVRIEDQHGNERQAPQTLVTKVSPATPFGGATQ